MTVITFTAKREIVPDTYLVSGTDISASDTDDSFNATVTDLSGIADNHWINVTSGVNAGWHQVITAVNNKITTTSALTTEAAGFNVTLDGYEHGLGISYELETAAQVAIDTATLIGPRSKKSLDGTPETIIHRIDNVWDIQTGIIMPDQLKYWEEFKYSVIGGESFTLDPYGTIAAPVKLATVIMDMRSLKIERVQNSQIRQLAFKARQL